VTYAFQNEKYIGVYRHGEVEVKDGCPKIIDSDLFFKVQEKLKTNRKSPHSNYQTRRMRRPPDATQQCGGRSLKNTVTLSTADLCCQSNYFRTSAQ
jgi:hypothetical protein